jgi:hypothetical protein
MTSLSFSNGNYKGTIHHQNSHLFKIDIEDQKVFNYTCNIDKNFIENISDETLKHFLLACPDSIRKCFETNYYDISEDNDIMNSQYNLNITLKITYVNKSLTLNAN